MASVNDTPAGATLDRDVAVEPTTVRPGDDDDDRDEDCGAGDAEELGLEVVAGADVDELVPASVIPVCI
jgi:hypothetical protein